MNLTSSVMVGCTILFLSAVIAVTFVHKYDYTRPIIQESFQQTPINYSDIENLKGNIVSVQNNGSGIPSWIISGRWKMMEIPSNTTIRNVLFSANLTMVGTDGNDDHKHRLSDFILSDLTLKNRTATIKGSVTLATLGADKFSGVPSTPIKSLPVMIKIFNLRTITINIDENKVNHHFGNSPIFGTVTDQG